MTVYKLSIYKHTIDRSIDKLTIKNCHINDTNHLYKYHRMNENGYDIQILYFENKLEMDLILAKLFISLSVEKNNKYTKEDIAPKVLKTLKAIYDKMELKNPELLI